jgi:hypothetical protein
VFRRRAQRRRCCRRRPAPAWPHDGRKPGGVPQLTESDALRRLNGERWHGVGLAGCPVPGRSVPQANGVGRIAPEFARFARHTA